MQQELASSPQANRLELNPALSKVSRWVNACSGGAEAGRSWSCRERHISSICTADYGTICVGFRDFVAVYIQIGRMVTDWAVP